MSHWMPLMKGDGPAVVSLWQAGLDGTVISRLNRSTYAIPVKAVARCLAALKFQLAPVRAGWPLAWQLGWLGLFGGPLMEPAGAAVVQPRYYAHDAVHDAYGVIAPWYTGLNGPCDRRVRLAAETLKRYPWTSTNDAIAAYPHYLFTSLWQISSNGVITPKNPGDWMNGDLGQRATSALNGLVDYYRYTGDAAAIAHVTYLADFLLDHCATPPDHSWPGVFVSVPVKGKPYGQVDAHGMIQLDLVGSTGQGLLRAYELVGNTRWFAAARHWGDLLAEHCNLSPAGDPWPRYANPEDTPWKDNKQTGGVTMILAFLDELIRLGYTGRDDRIVAARDAGQRYLRDRLLPAWTANDTWGRYFWDWANPVQNCLTTPDAAHYLLTHPREFPNWRADARNILTLFFNRSSVAPGSGGDVYSGAWAYPEASQCCGRSLWYAPLCLAPILAQYSVQAQDDWCRELAYRQMVLQTYDARDTGVTEDNIDGGIIVNGDWFNIAHPLPLRWVLAAIAWLPEDLGPSRENHLVRSTAVVNSILYGVGRIEYTTFDAPARTEEVLRLSFVPHRVSADGQWLARRRQLNANGYMVRRLSNGDAIVTIRHDRATRIIVTGADPQRAIEAAALVSEGRWETSPAASPASRPLRFSETRDASLTASFRGNQVRLVGRGDPGGGLADVVLDGEKLLVPVDCWVPQPRDRQVLFYRNGLSNGWHTLKLIARGTGNPYSKGTRVFVDSVQFSAENRRHNFPSGTGPRRAQRLIFGYLAREDYRDAHGHTWRPGTELVTRIGSGKDSVAECWWTMPAREPIGGTADPELYRYGVHASDFWVNLTVGPGRYHVRLKFAATRPLGAPRSGFDIRLNGQRVVERFDVAATAGGPNRAVDLVFNDVAPQNGIIEVRLTATAATNAGDALRNEAFIQALELEPGPGGSGATPVSALRP